jgi:hypothetical protein
MAKTVFEIAREVQSKLEDDLSFPLRHKEAFRQSFLADERMPEEMTQTRLNTMNNRFEMQNRANTWNQELTNNQLDAQFEGMRTQGEIDSFAAKQRLEDIKRQSDEQKYRLDMEKDKFDLQNIDRKREVWEAQSKADIAAEKQKLYESEDKITAFGADREFKAIMDKFPDWESMPGSQKAQALWEATRSKDMAIRNRAKLTIKESVWEPIVPKIKMLEDFIIAKQVYEGLDAPTSSQEKEFLSKQAMAQRATKQFDYETFNYLLDSGIIGSAEVAPDVQFFLESAQQSLQAIDPATGAPLPAAGGQPALGPTPVQPATPVDDEAPITPAAEAPVPQVEAPAPIPEPSADNAPSPETGITEYIAQNSGFTTDQVNYLINNFKLPKVVKDALTRDPTSEQEQADMIKALYKMASMMLSSGQKLTEEANALIGVMNTRATQLEEKLNG